MAYEEYGYTESYHRKGDEPPNSPHRLAFIGPSGVGKTSAARYLEERYGFHRLSFAQPMRKMVTMLWGMDPRFRTPELRSRMQHLGTDALRAMDEDVWVNLLVSELGTLPITTSVAIDDVRFPNEATTLVKHGFLLIRLARSDSATLNATQATHPSEVEQMAITDDQLFYAHNLNSLFRQLDTLLGVTP
jgi:DNA polymerase III delta prime subunit